MLKVTGYVKFCRLVSERINGIQRSLEAERLYKTVMCMTSDKLSLNVLTNGAEVRQQWLPNSFTIAIR